MAGGRSGGDQSEMLAVMVVGGVAARVAELRLGARLGALRRRGHLRHQCQKTTKLYVPAPTLLSTVLARALIRAALPSQKKNSSPSHAYAEAYTPLLPAQTFAHFELAEFSAESCVIRRPKRSA